MSSWAGVSIPSATTSAPHRSARSRRVRSDLQRRVADRAALDEREVDLDDVELELAQQPQPGVAGPDVVGGEADARRRGRPRGAAERARGPRPPRARSARGRCGADRARGGRSSGCRAWTLKSSISSVRGDRLMVSEPGQAEAAAVSMTVFRQAMSSSAVRPVASAASNIDAGSANPLSGSGRMRPSNPRGAPVDRS